MFGLPNRRTSPRSPKAANLKMARLENEERDLIREFLRERLFFDGFDFRLMNLCGRGCRSL
ncbi:hypothetical protein COLO4_04526 [Corchorus olitorius]|uniref:Uncharacterized protein n=1 Tax=Corchorus olitorius TaxID=93759 RepID=A0A1R3KTQ2_9ROSI|nr:hypothetical protein COLO4_04526 [Corchorus olitorius]